MRNLKYVARRLAEIAIAVAVCLILTTGCGGGFKGDGDGADILGPGIFGPDTAR